MVRRSTRARRPDDTADATLPATRWSTPCRRIAPFPVRPDLAVVTMSDTTPPGHIPDGAQPAPGTPGNIDALTALLRDHEATGRGSTPPPDPASSRASDSAGAWTGGPDRSERTDRKGRRRTPVPPVPIWLRIVAPVVIVILLLPVLSLGRAMATSNNLSVIERGAEWMRDNDLGFVLNRLEGWWLSLNEPKEGGEPDRAIEAPQLTDVGPTTTVKTVAPHLPKPANVPVPEGVIPVPNEGVWQPVGPTVGGAQAMYTTQVRPDSVRTSILDGLTWMDPKLLKFELIPGTEEPGGQWPNAGVVPMDRRLDLVAAFNGGFRMQDARGGFYLNGQTRGTLRDGAASLVFYDDGRVQVGMWGRDATLTPDVVGVRQNLALIIDNGGGPPNPGGVPGASAAPGEPVPGLTDNADGAWGETYGNSILSWRSAVGITADGAIVFGYGEGLGSLSLAQLMLRAGCVRAMQLDINSVWTTFNFYAATRFLDPTSVQGTKLLPDSRKPGNRYLTPDPRDFVGVFTRTF